MNIDNLGADQFMESMAVIAENTKAIMGSESGKAVAQSFKAMQADGDGKAVVKALLDGLPQLVRENGDSVYAILAACDGVTLEEYKEAFTGAKFLDDVRAIANLINDDAEAAGAFLAS